MPIEFLDLLDPAVDTGWKPLSPPIVGTEAGWSDGGSLADAPVDVAATFDGAAWSSTSIDESFGMTGVRLHGGTTVPRQHHNRSLLLLVFGGSITVRFTEIAESATGGEGGGTGVDEETAVVGAGQFCVIDAETIYSLTASADGATYLASWPQKAPDLETTWHPDPAWIAKTTRES